MVSITGDDIKRNFDDRNSNAKYFQDSSLKRLISFFSIENAFTILTVERFSVMILNIPPICLVFLLAFLLMLFPMVCMTNWENGIMTKATSINFELMMNNRIVNARILIGSTIIFWNVVPID